MSTVATVTEYTAGMGIQAGDTDGAGWDAPAAAGDTDGAGWDAPALAGDTDGAGWDSPTPTGLA